VAEALAASAPRFAGWALAVAEAAVCGPVEIAVVGRADDPARHELHLAALRAPSPGAVVAVGEPTGQSAVPLLAQRGLVDGRAAAYVCRGFVCERPVTSPEELRDTLTSAY
jgi:hypothetical protein